MPHGARRCGWPPSRKAEPTARSGVPGRAGRIFSFANPTLPFRGREKKQLLLLDLDQNPAVVDPLDAVDIKRRVQDHAVHVDLGFDRAADVDIGAEPEM